MTFHVARLSLLVLTSLALSSGASSAQEYRFPYRDPYLATITTAVLNADGHTPGAKRNAGKATPPEARKRIQDAKSFTFSEYYPYGGHLGNLWYPPTRDYVLGIFGTPP